MKSKMDFILSSVLVEGKNKHQNVKRYTIAGKSNKTDFSGLQTITQLVMVKLKDGRHWLGETISVSAIFGL